VPVLSVQMISTWPSPSTALRRFTTACFSAMRETPRARTIVRTMGRPSGMRETTRLTTVANMTAAGRCMATPNKKSETLKSPIMMAMNRLRRLTFFARGGSVFPSLSKEAMWPISVSLPVAVTTISPFPRMTRVCRKTAFLMSPRGACGSSVRACGVLLTGTDSPVRALSSRPNPSPLINRPSAGIWVPSERMMISPSTISVEGIFWTCPFRRMSEVEMKACSRAARAASARPSWMTPTVALKVKTQRMMMASLHSPMKGTRIATKSKMKMSGLLN